MQLLRGARDVAAAGGQHSLQRRGGPAATVRATSSCSSSSSSLATTATTTSSCWLAPGQQQHRGRRVVAAAAAGADAAAAAGGGAASPGDADGGEVGIYDVEELRGIRASLDGQDPVVEYRVRWKDGSPDTWELATNVSPDLVRDFDERWWAAAKKGDADTLTDMLQFSREILSQVVDDNRRSALHFAAAIGNAKCVKLLADAGADIDLQDKEGYTPLHMAAGYMHTASMAALLEAGADPLIKDKQGRDVVLLVENLRKSLPPNMAVLQRIMALEQVAAELTDRLYEEVEPAAILEERAAASGSGKEYLVQYADDTPDEWLPDSAVAQDLVDDWTAGLERAPVAALLDVQQWGTSREYLVQWADGAPDSWEDESLVPEALVAELQAAQPELFRGLKGGLGGKKKRSKKGPGGGKNKSKGGQPAAAAAATGADAAGGQQQQQPAAAAGARARDEDDGSNGGGGGSGGQHAASSSSHSSSHSSSSSSGGPQPAAALGSREAVPV